MRSPISSVLIAGITCLLSVELSFSGKNEDLKDVSVTFLSDAGAKPFPCPADLDITGFEFVACGQVTTPLPEFKLRSQREMKRRRWTIERVWELDDSDGTPAAKLTASWSKYVVSLEVSWPPEKLPTTVFLRWVRFTKPPSVPPTEQPECPAVPIQLSAGITPPERTNFVPPRYPKDARNARKEGKVVIEIVIDCSGRVEDMVIKKSNHDFDDAAMEAVSQWRYRPALQDGKAVNVFLTVILEFNLK